MSGTQLLEAAARDAIDRVRAKELAGIDPDVFADLGESLFWLDALARAKGMHKQDTFRAIGWARNRVAHGVLLTSPTQWQYGAEMGKFMVGLSMVGAPSMFLWLKSSEIATTQTQLQSEQPGATLYDQLMAGQGVTSTLVDALSQLTS